MRHINEMSATDPGPALFADGVGWLIVLSILDKASVAVHPGKLLNTFRFIGMVLRQQKSSYCAGKNALPFLTIVAINQDAI